MKKRIMLLGLFTSVFTLCAQNKQDEEIKREDVLVEYSFNPTLSDVFKMKTSPKEREDSFPKKTITYKINSKGVISDFKPVFKKAMYVNKDEPKPVNYRNYIYGAAGIYGNGEFEFLLTPKKTSQNYEYGVSLTSYNFQGGIDDDRVDNGQWDANIGLFLAKKSKKIDWRADIDFQNHLVNWYGLNGNITEDIYTDKDVKQVYRNLKMSGTIKYKDAFIKELTPSLQFFSDDYSTSEIDLNINTEINASWLGDVLSGKINFQYLTGGFNQSFVDTNNLNYNFLNLGVTPSYVYKAGGFQLSTELGLMINNNLEDSETNFLLLPKVQADVVLVENIMNLHGGIRSEFHQNSYASLATENPFISPTLDILSSYVPVDVFIGLDGALTENIIYGLEGSYKVLKDKNLFKHNDVNLATEPFEAYQLGNTFGVVYDDVNVISTKANIEVDLSKSLKTGGNLVFNSYDTSAEEKAWNLSAIEMETYINFHNKKWFSQLGINIVNGRYAYVDDEAKKLDGFFDVNLKGGYKINKKFNAHVNVYNMLSNNYQLYQNYGVQGIQAVVGLSYKF